MSDFEIYYPESGRQWLVDTDVLIMSRYGPLLVYAGFLHDLDTHVPNWEERDPVLRDKIIAPAPVAHDFIFWHRVTAELRRLTLHECNRVYQDLGRVSTNPWRRITTNWRFWWLERLPIVKRIWDQPGRPEPLPHHVRDMYGMNSHAIDARRCLPVIVTGVDGRLRWIPGVQGA